VQDPMAPHPNPEVLYWDAPSPALATPISNRKEVAKALASAISDGSLMEEIITATQGDPDLSS